MSTATDSIAVAAVGLAEAVRASANDPADQIRLLIAMANFAPTTRAGLAPMGVAIQAAQIATGAVFRRAALASLALATSSYQPSSYDDAIEIKTTVVNLITTEAGIAADALDTESFQALLALATAVATDLDTRGAQLPRIITVQRAASLPAPVLAYQLYGDASRSPELIRRANPPASLFMPRSFKALAS